MRKPIFCTAGDSAALRRAINHLVQWGYDVLPATTEEATHLLLPVPSLEGDGRIKGGLPLVQALRPISQSVTIIGGNLPPLPYPCIDFLQDEHYLQENAAITARCALELVQQKKAKSSGGQALIIGWGRIGKQLAHLLQQEGYSVTVAVRKAADQEAIRAQGYDGIAIGQWQLHFYDLIINTAPAPVLDQSKTRDDAFLLDLASVRGIEGDRVLWARGLPNQAAPDASGLLIAKTALRYALRKESL